MNENKLIKTGTFDEAKFVKDFFLKIVRQNNG